MADFTIYKHGHFTIFWSGLKFNDATIDVANYSFVCKIRDRKKNIGKKARGAN